MTTFVPLLLLVVLLALRLPVAFALLVSGIVGVGLESSFDAVLGSLETVPYRSSTQYALLTIPMFVLMAQFATYGGMTREIFRSLNLWLGRLPGGVALAALLGSAGMGAVSGSSVATAATMSRVSVPEMKRLGYSRSFALGAVSSAGTLAVMIPPSTGLVLYGLITDVSIGAMLLGGILPGILSTFAFAVLIISWAMRRRDLLPEVARPTWRERLASLRGFWPIPPLIVLVLGGIYSGAVTVVEASAVGAMGMLVVLLALSRRRGRAISESLTETAQVTTMIFTIIFAAHIFGTYLSLAGIPQDLTSLIEGAELSRWAVLVLVSILLLIMGAFMDPVAIMVLTLPILFPVMTDLGFDPVWFGIVVIKIMEIGVITPPLGLNIFVAARAAGEPVEVAFAGIWRFVLVELVTLSILCAFPIISTWLPTQSDLG